MKKTRFPAIILAFCLALALSYALGASASPEYTAEAGSFGDPFVTLSYLNSVLPRVSPDAAFEVVHLTHGQRLRSRDGSLELILRSGAASVISREAEQGIADMTGGGDLLHGESIPRNHYLLIPRADGRAVSVTSIDAYLMVRGDYEIY